MEAKTKHKINNVGKKKWWVLPVILTFVVFIIFFRDISSHNSNINNENYRVLFEASEQLNTNLNKLKSAHKNGESIVAIRAIFSSYKANDYGKKAFENATFRLTAKELIVAQVETPTKVASVNLHDILPTPSIGFSKYLFADSHGHVIATVGNENKLAFSNLVFLEKIFDSNNKSFFAHFNKGKPNTPPTDNKLPTYSTHADINLAHGNYRVYVYPFSLSHELEYQDNGEESTTPSLFLIGFIEESELSKQAISKWNVPIVIISVLSFAVLFFIIKLYFRSKNDVSFNLSACLIVVVCHLAFFASVSLVFAHFETQKLDDLREANALRYIKDLKGKVNREIQTKFKTLERFGTYFRQLYEINKESKANSLNSILPMLKNTEEPLVGTVVYVDAIKSNETIQQQLYEINKESKVNFLNSILHMLKNTEEPLVGTVVYVDAIKPNEITQQQKDTCRQGLMVEESKCITALKIEKSCSTNDEIQQTKVPLTLIKTNFLVTSKILKCLNKNINDIKSAKRSNLYYAELFNPLLKVNEDAIKEGKMEVRAADEYNGSLIPQGIISSLVINKHGNNASPSITFRETSITPETLNLGHREYFKAIRDRRGWEIKGINQQVYIQRLRNIANGTTGTTISMPLYKHSYCNKQQTALNKNQKNICLEHKQLGSNFVLIADVFFKEITTFNRLQKRNESLKLLNADLVHMVVNRDSGQILFHSQSDRALNENIYFSGNSGQGLTEWIKSATHSLEYAINGQYHGKVGRFYIESTAVDEWALVVFAPEDTKVWFMGNQFLFYFCASILLMLLLVGFIFGYQKWQYWLVGRVAFSGCVLRNMIFSAACLVVLLICECCLFRYFNIPIKIASGIFVLEILIVSRVLYHRYANQQPLQGFYCCVVTFVLFFAVLNIYEKSTTSLKGVALQNKNMICANQHSKQQELEKMALTLFPNSITNYQYSGLKALGFNPQQFTYPNCNNRSVTPDDFPHYATAKGNKHVWRWLTVYMLPNQTGNLDISELSQRVGNTGKDLFVFILYLCLLVYMWRKLHTNVLWVLLYFDHNFIRHIKKLAKDVSVIAIDQRCSQLNIIGDNIKLNGIELDLQLKMFKQNALQLSPYFKLLVNKSPLIKRLTMADEAEGIVSTSSSVQQESAHEITRMTLPNLKLEVKCAKSNTNKDIISVAIWDVETSLEHKEHRQLLLALITEIKGLVLSNIIGSFNIYSGLHSLQRVALKDAMETALSDKVKLDRAEYLSWSECLMDFNFQLMKSFSESIDIDLLKKEISRFPELKSVNALTVLTSSAEYINKEDKYRLECKWATINFILIHAEPFYRFKWELCSNAEKLALFNLAKSRLLNPCNAQVIEHLAMNGLIRVDNEQIYLMNESFTSFVMNAEPTDQMEELVKVGEQGVWKNNKSTILLLIGVMLISIAYFSGESLLVIFGSIAGILTSIAGITNSANLIRNHFK